ncbi:DUF362 domain-containing protein [Candidatus Bathyarchaeota archaeon]|nr:DUF362 domain-containing protein [Candidatus Bathyarchaeota archaeon]
MSLVSFVQMKKDFSNPYRQAIIESLKLIDYSFDKTVKKVVIKPNLCYYWDCTTGQTTDPLFVAELIDLLRERISDSVDIAVVESDASAMRCKYAFRMLGFEQLALEKNVRLVNLSEEESDSLAVSCNGKNYGFMVPRIIRDADLKINISKIKYTIDPIKLTCALKNMYGCNPYPKKYKYHADLGNVIVALNKAMKFNLCLIDNNVVSGVQPRKIGLVMASRDPVAIDVASAKIAWLNPDKIGYFHLAEREGVGSRSFVSKGLPLDYFKAMYPKKTFKRKMMGRAYKMVLKVGLGRRLGLE